MTPLKYCERPGVSMSYAAVEQSIPGVTNLYDICIFGDVPTSNLVVSIWGCKIQGVLFAGVYIHQIIRHVRRWRVT